MKYVFDEIPILISFTRNKQTLLFCVCMGEAGGGGGWGGGGDLFETLHMFSPDFTEVHVVWIRFLN